MKKVLPALIVEKVKPEDWLFGADNGIVKVKIPDISKYLPTNESQRFNTFDPWWCTNGATLNALEVIFNWMIDTNRISRANLKWLIDNEYLDENNKVNFDDWFLARISGTKIGRGNSLGTVAEAVRGFGLTPQRKSPFIIQDKSSDLEDYNQKIPYELYRLGEEFKKRFRLNYEIVYENRFMNALQYGGIVTGVSSWFKKGDFYINNGNIIHATLLFDKLPWRVFDTYSPFIKQLSTDYNFLYYGHQWYVTQTNSITEKLMDFWVRLKNGAIYWGKKNTNKIQKVTRENAGLVAVTHIMRQEGETIHNIDYIEDEAFKKFEVTEEFFGRENNSLLKKIFS